MGLGFIKPRSLLSKEQVWRSAHLTPAPQPQQTTGNGMHAEEGRGAVTLAPVP